MKAWMKILAACALLGLVACKDDKHSMYALTSTGTLIGFVSDTPATLTTTVSIIGLDSGESIEQIDYRPSTGTLYGYTSENRLATIDPSTGLATVVVNSAYPTDTLSNVAMGFDPVSDLMRVIANDTTTTTSVNELITPSTGVVYSSNSTVPAFASGDTNSSASAPDLVALAYDNHESGASTTTLYALDVTTQSLLRIGDAGVSTTTSADSGVLHTIGAVGVSFGTTAGLTILASSGDGYAALAQTGAASVLYKIDVGTGAATEVDTIGDGVTVISLTAEP